jgi:hypothetical protein
VEGEEVDANLENYKEIIEVGKLESARQIRELLKPLAIKSMLLKAIRERKICRDKSLI